MPNPRLWEQAVRELYGPQGRPGLPRRTIIEGEEGKRETALVVCGYCNGRGANPPTSVCPACSGKGHNRITLPYKVCPACKGAGDVDSSRCTCATCGGKGVVSVRERREVERPSEPGAPQFVKVKCGYCWGRGVDPFGCPGPKSQCQVCGGKGHNSMTPPYKPCPACHGTGKAGTRRMVCTACSGKGMVRIRVPMAECPVCKGAGLQPGSSSKLPCTTCGGTGQVYKKLDIKPLPKEGVIVGGETEEPQGRRGRREAVIATLSRPVTVEDRVVTHVSNFPGVRFADVQALFGLSKSEAKKTLKGLVKTQRIRKKEDELYYPA